MPVVAAGVHLPFVLGAVREFVLFEQRQRVHVGAQADRARAAALAQNADDAGLGQPAMHFQAVCGEFASDDVGGARFLEGKFGVRVDISADGDQIGNERNVEQLHGSKSKAEW